MSQSAGPTTGLDRTRRIWGAFALAVRAFFRWLGRVLGWAFKVAFVVFTGWLTARTLPQLINNWPPGRPSGLHRQRAELPGGPLPRPSSAPRARRPGQGRALGILKVAAPLRGRSLESRSALRSGEDRALVFCGDPPRLAPGQRELVGRGQPGSPARLLRAIRRPAHSGLRHLGSRPGLPRGSPASTTPSRFPSSPATSQPRGAGAKRQRPAISPKAGKAPPHYPLSNGSSTQVSPPPTRTASASTSERER